MSQVCYTFSWCLDSELHSRRLGSDWVEEIPLFHPYLHYAAFMFSYCIEMSLKSQTGFTFQSQDLEDNTKKDNYQIKIILYVEVKPWIWQDEMIRSKSSLKNGFYSVAWECSICIRLQNSIFAVVSVQKVMIETKPLIFFQNILFQIHLNFSPAVMH